MCSQSKYTIHDIQQCIYMIAQVDLISKLLLMACNSKFVLGCTRFRNVGW